MLVGLGYQARSGKDTVADHLVSEYGFVKLAFAGPLKEAAKVIFGWSDVHVYGDLKDTVDLYWGFSPRWALQKLGTEAVRQVIGESTWEMATMRKIHSLMAAGKDIVITDVRFQNEALAIIREGGTLWRVDRDAAFVGADAAAHVSETAMADFDQWSRHLDNNRDIGDLRRLVDDALEAHTPNYVRILLSVLESEKGVLESDKARSATKVEDLADQVAILESELFQKRGLLP